MVHHDHFKDQAQCRDSNSRYHRFNLTSILCVNTYFNKKSLTYQQTVSSHSQNAIDAQNTLQMKAIIDDKYRESC